VTMTNKTPIALDIVTVEFLGGTPIDDAAIDLVAAAERHGQAVGRFNGIELHAAAGYAPAGIVKFYNDECERRRAAYLASPEGQQAEAERNRRRQDLQSKHDALMARLPSLNMDNAHDVLDWLCEMQEPSDHVGVILRRNTIIERFETAGYKANENTGADYKPGDRWNMLRYLVGQALQGLKEGPAIHPILHKFADEWRARFPRAAA